MVTIEQIARAALNGESLLLRSLTQDLLRENPNLSEYSKPETNDSRVIAAAASFIELFALRLDQTPPDWTRSVGALSEPIYLLKAAGVPISCFHPRLPRTLEGYCRANPGYDMRLEWSKKPKHQTCKSENDRVVRTPPVSLTNADLRGDLSVTLGIFDSARPPRSDQPKAEGKECRHQNQPCGVIPFAREQHDCSVASDLKD